MHTLEQLRTGQLQGTTRLDLSAGLSEFPPEIFQLADSLEVLNLSGNRLSQLPHDLHRLKHLRVLFCSDNQFTELPESLGRCEQLSMVGFKANCIHTVAATALPTSLRWLILTDNCLERLPEQIGDCVALQKLMLAGNQLRELPTRLGDCKRLELLRIAANRLSLLPDWLLTMPRLAWLAYAGNPLPEPFSTPHVAGIQASVDWAQLRIEQALGEGASGVIQQAVLADGRTVALKLYKGEMTSDGSPLNEMNACIAAGEHPNLIKVIGRLRNHPQHRAGLVMELIDPAFRNLAGPPSLASCTRDVYPAPLHLRLPAVLRLASGIAAVAAHLHRQGINHGDLYAHNIQWREDGQGLLGDFGAASFYPADDQPASRALERIEVRAFGVLLGELLDHVPIAHAALRALQNQCVGDDVLSRPGFAEVSRQLQHMTP